jgi:nicotinate phosphoribosyltransferase
MKQGARLPAGRVTLDEARARAKAELDRLPSRLRALEPANPPFRVKLSAALAAERDAFRRRHEK